MSTGNTNGGFPYPNPDEPVANMDLGIKALAEAFDPHAIAVNRTAVQSIPSGTSTAVSFTAEDSDTFGNFAAPLSGIVVPSAGLYLVTACVGVLGTTGVKFAQLCVGATVWYEESDAAATGLNTRFCVSGIVKCAAADVVNVKILQTSGAAQNTFGTQFLALARLAITA